MESTNVEQPQVDSTPQQQPKTPEEKFLAKILGEEKPEETAAQPEVEGAEVSQETAQAPEQPIEDSEEVDWDGERYLVPKPLKEALMRQQDYTRKTQDIADLRRSLEAKERLLIEDQQFRQETAEEFSQLSGLDAQIKAYKNLDWQSMDVESFMKTKLQMERLIDAKGDIEKSITGKKQQLEQKRSYALQAIRAEGEKILQRTIPSWGPDLGKKIGEFAVQSYGFTNEETAGILDHRYVQVLHDAMQWRQLQAKTPSVQKRVESVKGVVRPGSRNIDPQTQHVANLKRALKMTKDDHKRVKIAEALFATKIR